LAKNETKTKTYFKTKMSKKFRKVIIKLHISLCAASLGAKCFVVVLDILCKLFISFFSGKNVKAYSRHSSQLLKICWQHLPCRLT